MKIAVIGGGFAGLATAYFLLDSEEMDVTLFDAGGVGSGASGAASGLLHPYPGISARRSRYATEAILVAKQLLKEAEKHTPKKIYSLAGILRASTDRDSQERLLSHVREYGDVEHLKGPLFLIHSGITVLSKHYLEGLTKAVIAKGAEYIVQKIYSLEELSAFDKVVIAAGYGIGSFPECERYKFKFIKGQALGLAGAPPYDKSFISKGYIAHLGEETNFEVGSTYEREFESDAPDLQRAKELLQYKLSLCPSAEIIDCKAGVRVCNSSDYAPIAEQIDERTYLFTGLGSRGLLYHGFYARELAQTILCKNKILG